MAAPIPTRNILVLTTGAAVAVVFVLHGLIEPPWDIVGRGAGLAAFASWSIGPLLLGMVAIAIGGVQGGTARQLPFSRGICVALAALVVAMTAGAMIGLYGLPEAGRFEASPHTGALAAVVGLGMALCTLFWQGLVQRRLGDALAPVLRAVLIAAVASMLWLPFWIGTESAIDSAVLWSSLALLSLMAALIYELGISLRTVAAVVGVAAAASTLLSVGLWV